MTVLVKGLVADCVVAVLDSVAVVVVVSVVCIVMDSAELWSGVGAMLDKEFWLVEPSSGDVATEFSVTNCVPEDSVRNAIAVLSEVMGVGCVASLEVVTAALG